MKKINITTYYKELIADTVTPVNLYLKLRDKYKNCLLLESSDYHSKENSYSFICAEPIINIKIDDNTAEITRQNHTEHIPTYHKNFNTVFNNFIKTIKTDTKEHITKFNGLYGYISYNAIEYFEDIKLNNPRKTKCNIPTIQFSFFKYIIAINHFNNELIIIENCMGDEASQLNQLIQLIQSQSFSSFKFEPIGNESSNLTDTDYIEMVKKGKFHCKRGDVFQIVLSRQFQQSFKGDDFNVYRSLRSINPSPYLFYFDYGNFKLMGSSPEAQIKIQNKKAIINPIAGTFKRTGNQAEDNKLATLLKEDKKENAEHVMLVDLARNDLGKNADNVTVSKFKEVQYFSHVIHLVSNVSGDILGESTNVIASTFPAGTLSGAPKYKAMELIDKYENQDRSFYGGAVGFIGLNGNVNLAITIRSFLSSNNTLFYQAGAGIVEQSIEESELIEVNNKLFALKKAINKAKDL